jgi:hypothetical protein
MGRLGSLGSDPNASVSDLPVVCQTQERASRLVAELSLEITTAYFARRRWRCWNPALIPGGRRPWRLVAGDDLFQVRAEILIERRCRASLPDFGQNFGDRATASTERVDHSHWPLILVLDNYLTALFGFFHHCAHVPREFGFCDADRHPTLRKAVSLDRAQNAVGDSKSARLGCHRSPG